MAKVTACPVSGNGADTGSALPVRHTPAESAARKFVYHALRSLPRSVASIALCRAWRSASGIASERLGGVAGAIIIPFANDDLARLIFFRDEIITAIRWAGTLEKTIEHGPLGPRLHPRSSFEEYKESVHGRCREWTRADMAAADLVGFLAPVDLSGFPEPALDFVPDGERRSGVAHAD